MQMGKNHFCLRLPSTAFQKVPHSSCHSSSLGQGDPVRLRNNSAKLGYLDGNVILSFFERGM